MPDASFLACSARASCCAIPTARRATRSRASRSRSSAARPACAACCGATRPCSRCTCWRGAAGSSRSTICRSITSSTTTATRRPALHRPPRHTTSGQRDLRGYGINGVMAHKGEALVRLIGLEAINGDGLALKAAPAARRRATRRFALRSKPDGDDKVAADWAPAARQAGTVSVSAEPSDRPTRPTSRSAASPKNRSRPRHRAEEPAPSADQEGESAASSDDTSELDALLASLERRRAAGRGPGGGRRGAADGSRARSPAQIAGVGRPRCGPGSAPARPQRTLCAISHAAQP